MREHGEDGGRQTLCAKRRRRVSHSRVLGQKKRELWGSDPHTEHTSTRQRVASDLARCLFVSNCRWVSRGNSCLRGLKCAGGCFGFQVGICLRLRVQRHVCACLTASTLM